MMTNECGYCVCRGLIIPPRTENQQRDSRTKHGIMNGKRRSRFVSNALPSMADISPSSAESCSAVSEPGVHPSGLGTKSPHTAHKSKAALLSAHKVQQIEGMEIIQEADGVRIVIYDETQKSTLRTMRCRKQKETHHQRWYLGGGIPRPD